MQEPSSSRTVAVVPRVAEAAQQADLDMTLIRQRPESPRPEVPAAGLLEVPDVPARSSQRMDGLLRRASAVVVVAADVDLFGLTSHSQTWSHRRASLFRRPASRSDPACSRLHPSCSDHYTAREMT